MQVIEVYIEIVKHIANLSGVNDVYFMDIVASVRTPTSIIHLSFVHYFHWNQRMLLKSYHVCRDTLAGIYLTNYHKMHLICERWNHCWKMLSYFKYCRKILIPVHNSGHWHLMEVNIEYKEFRDYNSLRDYMTDQEVAR